VKTATRDTLEKLLADLQAEPGLQALEERVLEAGHLEEDDYQALFDRRVTGKAYDNLRRHLLFCEICSKEFLKRAAPTAEKTYEEEDHRNRRRQIIHSIVLGIVAVVALVAIWVFSPEAPPSGEDLEPPAADADGGFAITSVWAGTGRLSGVPALAEDDRVYLRLVTRNAPVTGTWTYVFHVSQGLVRPLHPRERNGAPASALGGLRPAGGWDLPAAEDRGWLLVLASPKPLPILQTRGDRRSFARTIQTWLAEGGHLEEIPNALGGGEFLGLKVSCALVPIER